MNIFVAARTTLLVIALAFAAAATPASAQVRHEARGASADDLPFGSQAWWRAIAFHLNAYESSGAELIMGSGRFIAPKTIEVALNDGGKRVLIGSG